MSFPLFDLFSGLFSVTYEFAGLVAAAADAGGLAGLGVDEGQVGDVDGGLHVDQSALGVLGVGLHGLLDHVAVLDVGAALLDVHFEDAARGALVVAGYDVDHIAFLDMQFSHCLCVISGLEYFRVTILLVESRYN